MRRRASEQAERSSVRRRASEQAEGSSVRRRASEGDWVRRGDDDLLEVDRL